MDQSFCASPLGYGELGAVVFGDSAIICGVGVHCIGFTGGSAAETLGADMHDSANCLSFSRSSAISLHSFSFAGASV